MRLFKTLNQKRWITVFVTLGLALACGHVMQNVLVPSTPDPAAELARAEPGLMPREPRATDVKLVRPPILPDRVAMTAMPDDDPVGCAPKLNVSPAPAATLNIELLAPCHAQARAHITQADITASFATGGDGRLFVRMPALSDSPLINVSIAGFALSVNVDVPEAMSFDHIALQWSGTQTLSINAYEFGAQKSQFGHVWAGSPKSPARASRGSGGFLTRLGDGLGDSAEIYSFPARQTTSNGVIRLVAEAEVTRENCGRRITAIALQSSPIDTLRPTEVSLTMPACTEVGQTVRLQNLFEDMRLARR